MRVNEVIQGEDKRISETVCVLYMEALFVVVKLTADNLICHYP